MSRLERRDLGVLIGSRYPLILADVDDETRFLGVVRQAAARAGCGLWTWSSAQGLVRDGVVGQGQYLTEQMAKAVDAAVSLDAPDVFVFFDVRRQLEDGAVVRRLKELAQRPPPAPTVILTTQDPEMPPELAGLALPWRQTPPDAGELRRLVDDVLAELAARGIPVAADEAARIELVEAIRGVSSREAMQLINEVALHDGCVDVDDVPFVRSLKAELLGADGVLELIEPEEASLDAVGGLPHLKSWLELRGRGFEAGAGAFGLDAPRGVLLTGVPGCGKSMIAKTLASAWGMPLVLLDPGRLFGPYLGQSEGRLEDSLASIESLAPVVLWIDEIEKGFASESVDGGAAERIKGTFLRWMQERSDGVFVIATCNQVDKLPPEFLRKGRFDEVFFVDLPGDADRRTIFALHLAKRRRDPAGFELDGLAAATDGFSGAEIEAVVVAGLYRAFAAGTDLTTQHVLDEIAQTQPLSRTRAEDIAALRRWADGRAVPA